MEIIKLQDFSAELPHKMPVSVIMERSPSTHQWADYCYQAVGVIVADKEQEKEVRLIHQESGVEQFLITGLSLQLHIDECESYYHNLMSPKPGCFVVADDTDDPDEMPVPYLVSLSFDEAHAYHEGGQQVYAVEIPSTLYQWTEAYILTNYIANRKVKRKLNNWKQSGKEVNAENNPKL